MPRRSVAEARETRATVLKAAQKLFGAQGFAATSVQQIALGAGVTIGAVFHHFADKTALFAAVFEDLEAELDAQARAASRGKTPISAFLAGFEAFLTFAKRREYHRIVMIDGPAVLGASEWRAIDARLGLKTVIRGVENLISAGVISRRPVKPFAIMLLGAMNEAGFAMARREAGVTAEDCIAALRGLLR